MIAAGSGFANLHLLAMHAEIEAAQDRLEVFAGTADKRHHVGHDGEAAALDRARRARFLRNARAPEDAIANDVGEPFEHVDAHDAVAADAIAADAVEAARRGAVEDGRGQALAWPFGKIGEIDAAVLLKAQSPQEQAQFGSGRFEQCAEHRH